MLVIRRINGAGQTKARSVIKDQEKRSKLLKRKRDRVKGSRIRAARLYREMLQDTALAMNTGTIIDIHNYATTSTKKDTRGSKRELDTLTGFSSIDTKYIKK